MREETVKGFGFLAKLFFTFSWISVVAIGGGYAMLPIFRHELTRLGVVSSEDILKVIARAQSLPGPIAVNFALMMGSKLRGMAGAIAAVSGVLTPPIAVILTLGKLLLEHRDIRYVAGFLYGVRVVVIAMLVSLIIDMLGRYKRTVWELVAVGVAIVSLFKFPAVFVFAAIVVLDLFWKGSEA